MHDYNIEQIAKKTREFKESKAKQQHMMTYNPSQSRVGEALID